LVRCARARLIKKKASEGTSWKGSKGKKNNITIRRAKTDTVREHENENFEKKKLINVGEIDWRPSEALDRALTLRE